MDMGVAVDDITINEFRAELDDLVKNEKSKINFLTMLAHDAASTHAAAIVACIGEHIRKVPEKEKKLLALFLIDSIVKNDKDAAEACVTYRTVFASAIVAIFLHIFEEGDEKIRATLHKVRKSWTENSKVFPRSRLYGIDTKVQKIDPAWPVMQMLDTTAKTNVHVNPKFMQDEKPKVEDDNDSTELAILELKKRKLEKLARADKEATAAVVPVERNGSANVNPSNDIEILPKVEPVDTPATDAPIDPRKKAPRRRKSKDSSGRRKRKSSVDKMPDDVDLRRTTADASKSKRSKEAPPMLTEMSLLSRDIDVQPLMPAVVAPPPQPALSSTPINNRIFLDGKPYEVKFIGETPIVERDGLPHKVYFHGAPRNISIDGVVFVLAFGESITVPLGGVLHEVRFGAPSRELYIGRTAYRGQFNGPPIHISIMGARHEIRLSGPAPEVKIEPEPSHELTRYIQQATLGGHAQPLPMLGQRSMGILPPPLPPVVPIVTVAQPMTHSLLDALKTGDLLKAIQQSKQLTTTTAAVVPAREPTPPIPSGNSLLDVDMHRELSAPASIKQFHIRTLKVRYSAVIDALYPVDPDRPRCNNCGLRFTTHDSEAYKRHLDWHFRETSKAEEQRKAGANVARSWYLALEDWQLYSSEATENELAEGRTADYFGAASSPQDSPHEQPVLDAPNGGDTNEVCWVCNEPFDCFFDDASDAWKLRNAVVDDNKLYHPSCLGDRTLDSQCPLDNDSFTPLADVL